jgi:tetratricopeptide (TPR) repeat protein
MSIRLRLFVVTVLILSCFHPKPSDAQVQGNSPPTTAAPRPAEVDELATRAQDALKAGKLEDAARLYRQLVKQRPQSAEAWGYLAAALYNLNRYPEAREAYRHTTLLTPKNGPSWAYLGLCEYDMRDYPHAFDHLLKGEKLGLGNDRDLTANVKYHLALLWNTSGQFDRGFMEMSWFPEQNLGSQDIFEALGLSILRRPWFPYEVPADKLPMVLTAGEASFAESVHKPEEARKLYEALASNYPKERDVHYALGKFQSNLDIDLALKEYEKEIEITPSHVPARIEAAFLCLKMGQLDKGLTYAKQAATIKPGNSAAHNLVGRLLMELNRTPEAIPELALATRLSPQNSSFHLNLARAYQKSGNKTLAAKEVATFNQLESKRALPGAQPSPQ